MYFYNETKHKKDYFFNKYFISVFNIFKNQI